MRVVVDIRQAFCKALIDDFACLARVIGVSPGALNTNTTDRRLQRKLGVVINSDGFDRFLWYAACLTSAF
jgi:hypothetical protein